MVHESLKKLARLTNTSESLIGVDRIVSPQSFLRNDKKIKDFDPDQILEEALLKWLLIMGNKKEEFIKIAKLNLKEEFFKNKTSKKMFKEYLDLYDNKQPRDFLSLAITFGEENPILIKILNSKIVKEKAYDNFLKIVEEVLKRDWLEKRQNISTKINDPKISEDEAMTLVKEYDELKNNEPKIIFG